MTYALCLRIEGPDAATILPTLSHFFASHGGLSLQPIALAGGQADGERGVAEVAKKLYAISKDARDWAAGIATVGSLVMLFVGSPQTPTPPVAPPVSQQAEQVRAVRELLRMLDELHRVNDFSLELVDPKTGASFHLDASKAPADVISFCERATHGRPGQ